ncbi:MAG: hypothetical protein U0414_41715 [Polyangiaceae bacterium]
MSATVLSSARSPSSVFASSVAARFESSPTGTCVTPRAERRLGNIVAISGRPTTIAKNGASRVCRSAASRKRTDALSPHWRSSSTTTSGRTVASARTTSSNARCI